MKYRLHITTLKTGITRSKEFERKGLALYGCNPALKCSHGCRYCSTGEMLRTHKAFKEAGESPFAHGYAIVDPSTPERVARDAKRIRNRGLVQLCTIADAWAPEAQQYNLGRQCLEAILSEPDWTVRILTKNASVVNDYDLISQYRDRVLVGISLTGTRNKESIISTIEPNASLISERMDALKKAHQLGLRTYGMLCPLLPGISDSPEDIETLVRFCVECGAEEIFTEAVNPRGNGLILTQETLEKNGFSQEAQAIEKIRKKKEWSTYSTRLIQTMQSCVRTHFDIRQLRVLLYPKSLQPQDKAIIQKDDAGVVWL